ncbi:MAG: DUF1211 domain-containing protein [Cyclobacteriaceae bacterium]|nr:DUF1211 domain-containing protein [Cyclobacteriaceae bacterium]
MIRDRLKTHYIGMNKEFRYRGEETTRIETLSDAVFAIAIGLLLISATPPVTYYQLQQFTKDIIPFALCIALISIVWYEHFLFFVRYGFRNPYIVFLNIVLLFTVLFYVYPLKFLMRLLSIMYSNYFIMLRDGNSQELWQEYAFIMEGGDMSNLMAIYGIGAAAIFTLLMLMYRYALKKSAELELNEIEIFDTKMSIRSNLLMTVVPIFSVVLALVYRHSIIGTAFSGFIYFLYMPIMFINGSRISRERKKLLESQGA